VNRKLIFLVCAAVAVASGCNCRGCGDVGAGEGDAGNDAGNLTDRDGGSDGGPTDGGDRTDGGPRGDGGILDPTQSGGIPQGGFSLDGGSVGTPSGSGVQVSPSGGIILNSNDVQLHFAWVANNSAGTVSKYDTVNNKEVARYQSVLPVGGLRPGGANSPSRTAIDLNGDVWVANRAPGIQGSVTKIINDPSACPDRNHNGKIDTSRDLNGDGIISTNPADKEMIIPTDNSNINQYDECIVLTTLVGQSGTGVHARGLAVSTSLESATGDVWVALHEEKKLMRLDSISGQVVPANPDGGIAIDLPFGPYGLAVDGRKRLWAVAAPGDIGGLGGQPTLAAVDVFDRHMIDPLIKAPFKGNNYGIAIDGKSRVWLAAWTGGGYVYRYERPDNLLPGTWTRFYIGDVASPRGTKMTETRGIAADESGLIWVDSDRDNNGNNASQLIAINGDDGGVRPFTPTSGAPINMLDVTDGNTYTAIGVGVDVDGNLWINNNSGNVVKVNRTTGDFIRLPNQSGNFYTYSDFTGYQLRHFTAPQGTFRYNLAGCDNLTEWKQLIWDAVTPANTAVTAYVRVANSLADLNDLSQPRYGPYTSSPADLTSPGGGGPVPPAQYMRAEFVLSSTDRVTSPELRSFRGVWNCPIILK